MKTKLTRDAWLQAGFEALDRYGYEATSAQALARRLNVTRGSLYHHFASRQDFVQQLLHRWEVDYTVDVLTEANAATEPFDKLQRYIAIAARLQPGREVAIRAWATRDKWVQELLQSVEGLRLEFAREAARALLSCSAREVDVEAFAQLAYLGFIGMQHTAQQGDRRFVRFFADLTDLGRRMSIA